MKENNWKEKKKKNEIRQLKKKETKERLEERKKEKKYDKNETNETKKRLNAIEKQKTEICYGLCVNWSANILAFDKRNGLASYHWKCACVKQWQRYFGLIYLWGVSVRFTIFTGFPSSIFKIYIKSFLYLFKICRFSMSTIWKNNQYTNA